MNKLFYAVCDDNGICDFKNDKYQTLKTIFRDKSQAELMVNQNTDTPLIIVPVYIQHAGDK